MAQRLAAAILGLGVALFSASSCAGKGDCRYNSDCTGAYCFEGTCKKDCVDATVDCPRGYTCNAVAQCEPPVGDGGTNDGATSDGATNDGAGSDGATSDGSTADGGTPKRLLDRCANDGDCASNLCRAWSRGAASRCTKTCATDGDCMTGTRCTAVGAETYCVASDVGRACTAATDCNFACLLAQQYCTAKCVTGADCPNGYGCQPVGSPATNVCVKASAYCDGADTSSCIAPAACDSSAALLVTSCTLACNSVADCPVRAIGLPAWTCDGLCRRPADVYGPLAGGERASYACNAAQTVVTVCNDAQHMDFGAFTVPAPPAVDCMAPMTTDGPVTDRCVDSCRYRGGCAQGFACTAVGSVGGGRIGLCLPALGPGEVGAPCSTDSACFFGYCNRTTNKCSRDCTADGLCPAGSTCNAGGTPVVEGMAFRRCE
ncbi:MAG: hypothetical protein KF819_18020 [Labilithrix sp.]|nr:hypothetical protein [Labilithrix sp.]